MSENGSGVNRKDRNNFFERIGSIAMRNRHCFSAKGYDIEKIVSTVPQLISLAPYHIIMETKKEGAMAELQSTLRVFNAGNLEGGKVAEGQLKKRLTGYDECPSERLRVNLRTFEAGTQVPLHWHPIEALYYVISGRAVMTDIEGNTHDIGPGSVIYYPAGIAGSHGWDFKEQLQLISVRATTTPEKNIQFTVDTSSKVSSIEYDDLIKQGGAQFKSFY